MKRLSIILLAILLVLGFGLQVGAEPTGFDYYADVGFSGNETLIDFEDVVSDTEILGQYAAEGVTFSEGLYGWLDLGFFPDNPGNAFVGTNFLDYPNWRDTKITFDPPVTHVGFDVWVQSSSFSVTVHKDGTKAPSTLTMPIGRIYTGFVGVADPEGIHQLVIGTPGQAFAIDNFRFETVLSELTVSVDIKPGSCMNPFNIKSRGVLPVAIHGAEDLDVNEIDLSTVQLMGVAPVRHGFDYVSDCNSDVPDDKLDLVMKFDRQEIVKAIDEANGEVNAGDMVTLNLTGDLYDGTKIVGEDVVAILAKGRHKKHWKKRWKKHWKKHWKEHRDDYGKEEWKEQKEEWKEEWKEHKDELKEEWKEKHKEMKTKPSKKGKK